MDIKYLSLQSKVDNVDHSIRAGLHAIISLDFTNQKNKFVADPDFYGWTKDNVEFAEVLYKNYLFLCLKYNDVRHLPPSTDIDDFWHGHILDTHRYSADCNRIFGHVLHHNPYFGFGSNEAEKDLSDGFSITQDLHTLEFGAPIYEVRN